MNENEKITPEGHSRVEYLLEQLIEKVEESSGGGTTFKYGGRVDTKADLDLITGTPNQIYFVGLIDSQNFDEYVWAEPTGAASGHWDLLGTTTIVTDSALDKTSHNPIQNAPVATAIESLQNTKANASDLATVATSGSYNDLLDKPTIPTPVDISGKTDLTVIAPTYDDQATYSDGDYYTRGGKLYKIVSGVATEVPVSAELTSKMDAHADYFETSSGKRFYISDTTPTGTIPEGSYGIGF